MPNGVWGLDIGIGYKAHILVRFISSFEAKIGLPFGSSLRISGLGFDPLSIWGF